MATTPLHGYPYPEGQAQPQVHLDLKALADGVDADTLVTCTSTTRPAHRAGRLIFETDTGALYVSTGTAWLAVHLGTRVYRQDYPGGTTDASGFLTINHTCPFTPTAIQVSSRAPGSSFAVFHGADSFTATQARLRFFNASSAGAYASAATGAFTALFWQ